MLNGYHFLALLPGDPATAPHEQGVLVIDDTGDRDPACRTKPRIAVELVAAAVARALLVLAGDPGSGPA